MAAPSKQKLIENYLAAREAFEKAEAAAKKALSSLPPGTYPIAGVNVQVKAGSKLFQKGEFESKYPADTNPEYYSLTVDTEKVKPRFAQIELDQFYKTGAPSVVIPTRKA